MKNLDLDELEIFRAVAETGAVTRASEQLGRVPSNVSTRLRQLEARLGTPLFDRHGGRLTLSSEGRLLLAYADRILRLSAEAEATVKSGKPRGVLRIGSLESTAATRLPPILGTYHRAYPEVRLELVTGTSGALVSRVVAGEIEAAFVAEPFSTRDLEMQHAFNEQLVLITPKSVGPVKDPRDLDRATVIAFAAGCSYRRRLDDWLRSSGCVPARVMEFGSYHAIVACVAAGAGIAVVPRSVLRVLNAERAVTLHPLPARVAEAKTQLVWREGHRSLALDALQNEVPRPEAGPRSREDANIVELGRVSTRARRRRSPPVRSAVRAKAVPARAAPAGGMTVLGGEGSLEMALAVSDHAYVLEGTTEAREPAAPVHARRTDLQRKTSILQ